MIKSSFTFMPQPLWRPEGDTQGGGGGTDTVAAGGGADTIAAGGGADTVAAGGGADTIEGGASSARTAAAPNALKKEGDADTKGAGDWPADWRERAIKAAGADEKTIDRLKRMDSPGALLKSYLAADAKINSGKLGDEPMPDPAKDADGAKAWRTARGIPDDPTGYKLPDDMMKLLTDEDKPALAAFYADAHKAGVPQQHVQPLVGWYLNMLETQAVERNALDKTHSEETEEVLRAEWGSDFKPNRTIAKRYADEVVPGLFDARLPDGRIVGNTPAFVKGLAKLGLQEYGDVAFAGGEQATVTENRKAELKKILDTDIDRWNAEPALRAEYGKLLAAEEKRPGRAS